MPATGFTVSKPPATAATRFLKDNGATFQLRLYEYVEHGGTGRAASGLDASEHAIIKTLVFENERKEPFLVLMHGDREVSAKELARQLGCKSATPCDPQAAQRHTGYQVGGISPFGTRKALPVCLEKSILELPVILINAGKRGALAQLDPAWLPRLLPVRAVTVAR